MGSGKLSTGKTSSCGKVILLKYQHGAADDGQDQDNGAQLEEPVLHLGMFSLPHSCPHTDFDILVYIWHARLADSHWGMAAQDDLLAPVLKLSESCFCRAKHTRLIGRGPGILTNQGVHHFASHGCWVPSSCS